MAPTKYDGQGIADVVAEFYEELYFNDEDTQTRTRGQVRATPRPAGPQQATSQLRGKAAETRIRVKCKNGDPSSKLFRLLLFKRLQPTLDASQSVDQAGFRLGCSTVCSRSSNSDRAAEWHQPLRVAAIDFKRAFDTVEHSSVWKPCEKKAFRGHTHRCSQSFTTNNEQQYTLTLKTKTSISGEEPSRETRSARFCFLVSFKTS